MTNVKIFFYFMKNLYAVRFMLTAMAARELKATYVGSFFGFSWAVLNPVCQIAIYGVVFGIFMKGAAPPQYGTDSFFLYLVAGLIPWQFLAQTMFATTTVLLTHKNLVKRAAGFPCEVLPIVTVISNLVSQLVSVALLFAIVIIFTHRASPSMLLVLIHVFFLVVILVGIGWVLSSLTVFLRDVPQVMALLLTGLFFFIPVVYSPTLVPKNILFIMKLNPLYHVIEAYRLACLAGRLLPLPDMAYLAVSSFVIFGLGGIFFRKLKPVFAEVI